MSVPLATLEEGSAKAEIYESALPGEFSIRYLNREGKLIAEEPLTGVSTYRQREQEIRDRLLKLTSGEEVDDAAPLADSGEY